MDLDFWNCERKSSVLYPKKYRSLTSQIAIYHSIFYLFCLFVINMKAWLNPIFSSSLQYSLLELIIIKLFMREITFF